MEASLVHDRAPTVGARPEGPQATLLPVPHVVAGRVDLDMETEYRSRDTGAGFVTPRLELDGLAPPRTVPGPAFETPIEEIYDFLVETGARLTLANPYLAESLERISSVSTLSSETLTFCYDQIGQFFDRASLEFQVEQQIGQTALDGWKQVVGPDGGINHVRAFPPRVAHVLAGNSPAVAVLSIVMAALTKGVHVLKMASNDLFTATAVLRTMVEIDPRHPVTRSLSAVYWRGGDERIEGAIYRAQYFDKLVAWGGGGSIKHAHKFVGPGFELVAFDPKTSISIIGHEAFASDDTLRQVADLAATDACMYEQDACASSRFQFVEGSLDEVDRYCEALARELGMARDLNAAQGRPTPRELREEVDGVRFLQPAFRVFGDYQGRGLVVRSLEPVDFHPDARTVNVVPVGHIREALPHVNVSTQTVGVYPAHRKIEIRDGVVAMGGQRVLPLGRAGTGVIGLPQDGMCALNRLMKWVVDMDGPLSSAG